jgi:hypothetical protein
VAASFWEWFGGSLHPNRRRQAHFFCRKPAATIHFAEWKADAVAAVSKIQVRTGTEHQILTFSFDNMTCLMNRGSKKKNLKMMHIEGECVCACVITA